MGYWNFDEGTGSSVADSSGNGNTGSLVASPTWTASGKINNALSFNGTSQYVSIPDSASLDIPGSGSVTAWVKLSSLNRWHGVVGKGNINDSGQTQNYAIEVDSTNHINGYIGNGTSANSVSSSATVSSGVFVHLALVWNGSNLIIYINGTANNSVAQTVTPASNASPLYIAQYGGNRLVINCRRLFICRKKFF